MITTKNPIITLVEGIGFLGMAIVGILDNLAPRGLAFGTVIDSTGVYPDQPFRFFTNIQIAIIIASVLLLVLGPIFLFVGIRSFKAMNRVLETKQE